MRLQLISIVPILFLIITVWLPSKEKAMLEGKTICLDPGHGGTGDTDQYRVGPTGEREEWVNLRVAMFLKEKLEASGAKVVMTREKDVHVPLDKRSEIAVSSRADLFLSIHHNATADSSVNFPIVYFHGSANENRSGVKLAKLLASCFREYLFKNQGPVSVVSDFTIFPTSGTSVLRGSYGIPGAIAEASFFSNVAEEERLKSEVYNEREAQGYFSAIVSFFQQNQETEIREKVEPFEIPVFPVFQEAERMKPEALKWKESMEVGKELFDNGLLDRAFEKFTLSIKSFPDSYLAREAQGYRVKILNTIGSIKETQDEIKRLNAFYPEY